MPIGRMGTWPGRVNAAVKENLPSGIRQYITPRMITMLVIVAVVLVLVFGYIKLAPLVSYLMNPGQYAVPPQSVSTVHAQKTLWQTQLRSVGTLHAVEGADLASEVAGLVTRIGFQPGEDVRAGTLLVQLRDDSEQAAAEEALLTYRRYAALLKTQAISQSSYDSALANLKSTRAAMEKKAIRAPYDGRVGIRQVDVGQYVNAGQVIVTLQQLDPIFVDFQVPQQQLSLLTKGDKVTLVTDAAAGRNFYGEIVAFDPKVDPDTRNVRVRASIRNPDKTLLPGMFATAITNVGSARPLITLPQTAVVYNPYGDTVFVVAKTAQEKGGEQLVAQQRFVTVGETRGDQVAILSGLSTEDIVVSAGQIKLKNGTVVSVNNSVTLPNNPAPTPVDQ
ncbi:MAG TPA: efflux RND transporter periplasmic adaptor subunit [Rhizomicrobium sp.]